VIFGDILRKNGSYEERNSVINEMKKNFKYLENTIRGFFFLHSVSGEAYKSGKFKVVTLDFKSYHQLIFVENHSNQWRRR
jgi:hypothetical protein